VNRAPSLEESCRLDQLLVERGLFATRSRAGDAIRRGAVAVAGRPATKAGALVPRDIAVSVDDPAAAYVSRAALKLIGGLDGFGLSPSGREVLDIGASTGGFTQVLLERGAAHVTALDVGHGQIAASIAADPRVTVVEGVNARDLTPADLSGRVPGALVCDVSFISLALALPPALALAAPGAFGVFLVKPQFEAGRAAVGKGGLVDVATGERVARDLARWLANQPGWKTLGLIPSPLDGADGNREYLLAGEKAP